MPKKSKNNNTIARIWELPVPVMVNKKNNTVDIYITDSIQEPFVYNELCHVLLAATKETTAYIHINTPGGIIDSAFMIANAIKESKARVVGKLLGTVASAGTLIAMACDELQATPNLSFMIHNYSGGMEGKGHEMKARQKFTDEHLNDAFTAFYSGFLNSKEMASVIEGTDLWMGTTEVTKRWSNRVSLLKGEVNVQQS